MRDYPDRTYEVCSVGIRTVRTVDIIGLSLRPEDIANDNKMKRLRRSVEINGWKDYFPGDLHLYLTPEGKYTVCTGGNHRPYLADELGIPAIEADVDVIIPKNKIPKNSLITISRLRQQYRTLELEAKEGSHILRTQISRKGYDNEARSKLDDLFNELSQVHTKIEMLLKEEAYTLGYIPKSWIYSD
ncbi:hypothetical protein ACTHSJ_33765 [Paenibacillus cellulositrophicus]|uniref:hypothetical protein n=1 Tax=Paenibacillus cellulositrophicus TaxID=562959 RepID=UPI003F81CB22